MTSNRLIPIQHVFDFVDEVERPSAASEPQRGQSDLAAMKKTALGSTSENLMERIVEFARRSGIPISSRGSASSSLVAHCLGITDPDPIRLNLLKNL